MSLTPQFDPAAPFILHSDTFRHIAQPLPPSPAGCAAIALIERGDTLLTCRMSVAPPPAVPTLNQASHYLLAGACGVPHTPLLGLMQLQPAVLSDTWPGVDWGDAPLPVLFQPLASDAFEPVGMLRHSRLTEALAGWRSLVDAAALHEWSACNSKDTAPLAWSDDAFLLTGGCGLFGGPDWTPQALKQLPYCHNKLLWLAFGGALPAHVRVEMDRARARHAAALDTVRGTLYLLWRYFAGSSYADAAVDFLTQRSRPTLNGRRTDAAARP